MGIMWLFRAQSLEAVALGVRGEGSITGEGSAIGDGSWRLRMGRVSGGCSETKPGGHQTVLQTKISFNVLVRYA